MEGERWRFAGIDEDPRRDYTTYATHAITTIAMQRDEDADTVGLYAATEPANGDTIPLQYTGSTTNPLTDSCGHRHST